MESKLICRKSGGYMLVIKFTSCSLLHETTKTNFICKSSAWEEMQHKIHLAEELFGCKCLYENFKPEGQ